MFIKMIPLALIGASSLLAATPANAALKLFNAYSGSYGLSTSGAGSLADSYTVNAYVPVGGTVVSAYLYQTTYVGANQPVTLNGTALTFSDPTFDASATYLSSSRADVTSLVSSVVNGGTLGTYGFNVGEGNTSGTDGTALVVVYSLASLPNQTVAILDGSSASAGDTTTLNFAQPLDPSQAGFVADLRLGIGFSAGGQSSSVAVNGTTITTNAGNFDDGVGADGALITVGDNNDPYSSFLPSYAADHERYNIAPYISAGDTSIRVDTFNASQDDNIFLATFVVSGTAAVNAPAPSVPEPATWAMMIVGFGAVGCAMRSAKRRSDDKFDAKVKRIASGALV